MCRAGQNNRKVPLHLISDLCFSQYLNLVDKYVFFINVLTLQVASCKLGMLILFLGLCCDCSLILQLCV